MLDVRLRAVLPDEMPLYGPWSELQVEKLGDAWSHTVWPCGKTKLCTYRCLPSHTFTMN